MDKQYTSSLLERYQHTPRFTDGRIDFSKELHAPVVNVFVKYKDTFLLLKRSEKVGSFQGHWHVVGGYLDEPVSVMEKVYEELEEEINLTKKNIASITLGEPFTVHKGEESWHVHPTLVEVNEKPTIKLDWEHDAYAWATPEEFTQYKLIDGFMEAFTHLNTLLSQ